MEFIDYLKYFGVLAILIVGILVAVLLIKKVMQPKARASAQHNDIFNSKSSSLFIQEVLPVDQKTKIIIVGRDSVRHVILLGETHSQLIETVAPDAPEEATADFVATNHQVGSIVMTGAGAASSISTPADFEPDVTNIKPEKPADEPALITKSSSKSTDIPAEKPASTTKSSAKSDENKSQIEDDLQNETKPKDDNLKDIKDKLNKAKDLAKPSTD